MRPRSSGCAATRDTRRTKPPTTVPAPSQLRSRPAATTGTRAPASPAEPRSQGGEEGVEGVEDELDVRVLQRVVQRQDEAALHDRVGVGKAVARLLEVDPAHERLTGRIPRPHGTGVHAVAVEVLLERGALE